MNISNKDLKRRIIEISYKHKLSHLGSCLTAVDIIEEIYSKKKPDEKFVLSSGHAGLALYAVIEKYKGINAEEIFNHHGVHPDRCERCHLDCSTGSLGQGLPIAVGMALADRSKNVYCLISDGECAEGSIWEALHFMQSIETYRSWNIKLKLYVNLNGWGAYDSIKIIRLMNKIKPLVPRDNLEFRITADTIFPFPFIKGQDAHYYVMQEDDYKSAMEILL